jgi:hypothetical protein
MPEFVVAPRIVIASPMLGIASERKKLINTITKVTNAFCLLESFYSG